MTPFFASTDAQARLIAVAESWLGTPFHAHGKVKGAGCSCQTLVEGIYRECGALPADVVIPTGSLRAYRAQGRSLIAEHIDSALAHVLRPVDGKPLAGDLLLFLDASCEHSGVALPDGRFVHAQVRYGVSISRLDDATYLQRLKRIWRPMA